MSKADFDQLKRAVEELHGCEANYLSTQHVRESFEATRVFDGGVSLFAVTGHPASTMCYAWSAEEPDSSARSYYAVLRLAPIESARDAVRAALALRHRVLPS
jgi:hypothetical protein